ncbi:MAG: hypothetical protein LM582_02655 [Desulfurococcaceae archaeon]|nr:hypothetical protein [Desulfurococcaceae archaeon]
MSIRIGGLIRLSIITAEDRTYSPYKNIMFLTLTVIEMRVSNSINLLDLENTINLVNDILTLLEFNIVKQSYVDPLIINARYYIAIHNVFLPMIIRESESSIPKVYLTPIASIYIHDQKVYAVFKLRYGVGGLSSSIDVIKVPIVDLTVNEKLLILASVAIAYKMLSVPNERNILRILPNNIKTYVEIALDIFRENSYQYNIKTKLGEFRHLNLVELVLWINNINDNELTEVSYIKGLATNTIRILYRDYEVDFKILSRPSQKLLLKILTLLPMNVLNEVVNNVKNAYKILRVFRVVSS